MAQYNYNRLVTLAQLHLKLNGNIFSYSNVLGSGVMFTFIDEKEHFAWNTKTWNSTAYYFM